MWYQPNNWAYLESAAKKLLMRSHFFSFSFSFSQNAIVPFSNRHNTLPFESTTKFERGKSICLIWVFDRLYKKKNVGQSTVLWGSINNARIMTFINADIFNSCKIKIKAKKNQKENACIQFRKGMVFGSSVSPSLFHVGTSKSFDIHTIANGIVTKPIYAPMRYKTDENQMNVRKYLWVHSTCVYVDMDMDTYICMWMLKYKCLV